MENLILTVMLLCIVVSLVKREKGNNIFALLCVAAIVTGVWTLPVHHTWTWNVISLYVTALAMAYILLMQKEKYLHAEFSIFTWMYGKKVTKEYGAYSKELQKKTKKFGRAIKKFRVLVFFVLCVLIGVYSYLLVSGMIWWKWIIVGPVGIAVILLALFTTKLWLDKL